MRYVTTKDGTELYVKDWGMGHPVIMLHGWPLSSDTFDNMALALANDGYRAIAYDRRGFGRSEQPWTGYDYNTLTDDLAAVMEQTGAEDVTLVGFSMGGGEVARYMSRYGGRHVRNAVLIASVVPYMLKTPDNPEGVSQETFDTNGEHITADRAKFWSGFFREFYGTGLMAHPVSDEIISWSRAIAMQASLKATLACAEAFATTDFRPDLASFSVPTLLIHGTGDKIVPIDAASRKAAAAIPHATLIEYEGDPHGLLASSSQRVIDDVRHFIHTSNTRPAAAAMPESRGV